MPRRFSDDDVQRFLGSREIVVLATLQPDGSPLAMPMWFWHDRDALTLISEADTQKVRNVRRDPRVSVVAEAGTRDDARAVILSGEVEFLQESPARRALVRVLLDKYKPHLGAKWGGDAMPANLSAPVVN